MTDYIAKRIGKNNMKMNSAVSMEHCKLKLIQRAISKKPRRHRSSAGKRFGFEYRRGIAKKKYMTAWRYFGKNCHQNSGGSGDWSADRRHSGDGEFARYDNNLFAEGISSADYQKLIDDKNLPLFNRAVNGEYPPGSTFKMAVASAALSEGTITPETTVNDASGAINVGAYRFGDWKTHGLMNVRSAIAQSCDVFFYALGGGYGGVEGLGIDRIKKICRPLWLWPSDRRRFARWSYRFYSEWKLEKEKLGENWYIGDSYHSAIGQGFITVTLCNSPIILRPLPMAGRFIRRAWSIGLKKMMAVRNF